MSTPANELNRTFLARRYSPETFVYHIDIAGTCNLGCSSCPVGNTPLKTVSRGARPRGFMSFEHFSKILEKIPRVVVYGDKESDAFLAVRERGGGQVTRSLDDLVAEVSGTL